MGGLGFGGLYFGRRTERTMNPIRAYGWLEIGASILAIASLLLLELTGYLYVESGGTAELGPAGATAWRLALAVLAIGPCAFAMGGNLPYAVKYLQRNKDARRRGTAVLYALNALGAVAGTLATTFWFLEHMGSTMTVILASLINGCIGAVALGLARRSRRLAPIETTVTETAEVGNEPPQGLQSRSLLVIVALCCSFLSGFLFFTMEAVWLRMLIPLMGGSVYVPGAMLTVVLFGITMGGLLYSARASAKLPTLNELAIVLGLFGLALAVPWALGDRLAVLAYHLNQLRGFGFWAQIAVWHVIAAFVCLIPSLVAGYQFPLFVGLLGTGSDSVGRHLGFVYAVNTLGAIFGSLASGLWLLPSLGALSLWRVGIFAVSGMCVAAAVLSWICRRHRDERNGRSALAASCCLIVVIFAMALPTMTEGPTAIWRHMPIGYGGRIKGIPNAPADLTN